MKTVRRPPYPKWNPGYFPCSSLTPPSAFLTPSIGVLRWIRAKHRHQEFLRFLRRLDREFSKETPLHLIVDNYGTHNQSKVKAWLEDSTRGSPCTVHSRRARLDD